MKRSKWCKYCPPSKKHINLGLCERIISNCPCGGPVNNAEDILQQYRDRLAKLVRETRYIEDNGFIECARMLDPEKSARVAACVQEIKAWMEQHD